MAIDDKAAVAQGTEQGTSKPLVTGSNPVGGAISFEQSSATGYRGRTIENVRSADVTLQFAVDYTSAGERLTSSTVGQLGKPSVQVDMNQPIDYTSIARRVAEISGGKPISINVAGNGIYTVKGKFTQQEFDSILEKTLAEILKSTQITEVRSGGQTGADEAGVKAAAKLGIKAKVLAPSGYKFRNIEGIDVANESAFKARFQEAATVAPSEVAVTPKNTQNFSPAERVARLLNEFADMRAKTSESVPFTDGVRQNLDKTGKVKLFPGDPTVVSSQIDRAVGASGAITGRHYFSDIQPRGIDQARTLRARIADLSRKLNVPMTAEYSGKDFIASQAMVADAMHDFILAVEAANTDPSLLPQDLKEEIAALTLEASRVLHDYSDGYSRSVFERMNKKPLYNGRSRFAKTGGSANFGLASDAAEIAALGIEMPTAPGGMQAKARRVASAQVGMVPQSSIGDEPSTVRPIRVELANDTGNTIPEMQRHVDEFGVYGTGDVAHIDVKGSISGEPGKKTYGSDQISNANRGFRRFLDSDLGFLADGELDLRRSLGLTTDSNLKLSVLEQREFSTPIQVRTNHKYYGGTSGDTVAQRAAMKAVIAAADRATAAASGSLHLLPIADGKEFTIKIPQDAMAALEARAAEWRAARDKVISDAGPDVAKIYMKSPEGIALFGSEPKVFDSVTIKGPTTLVIPEAAAARIIAANQDNVDLIASMRKLPELHIRFEAEVRPQYHVLKNGTIVSPRAEEAGFSTFRKVHLRRVVSSGGVMSIEPMDSRTFRITDPGQRYDQKKAEATYKRAMEIFSAPYSDSGLEQLGLKDEWGAETLKQVEENLTTEAYEALEILGTNGDMSPQLEADLISHIISVSGEFRADRAPEYVKARNLSPDKQAIADAKVEKRTALERVKASGKLVGRTITGSEALQLPRRMLSSPSPSGTVYDVLHNPEVFGVTRRKTVDHLPSIIRGLRLLERMATIATEQFGYGGITKKSGTTTKRFWVMADRTQYDSSYSAIQQSEDLGALSRPLQSDISIDDEGSAALRTVEGITESIKAAGLAARASLESARGLLGDSWSPDLSPEVHRTRFPESPAPEQSGIQRLAYPEVSLLDTLGLPSRMSDPNTPERPRDPELEKKLQAEVLKIKSEIPGELLKMMSDSGALGPKAEKFFISYFGGKESLLSGSIPVETRTLAKDFVSGLSNILESGKQLDSASIDAVIRDIRSKYGDPAGDIISSSLKPAQKTRKKTSITMFDSIDGVDMPDEEGGWGIIDTVGGAKKKWAVSPADFARTFLQGMLAGNHPTLSDTIVQTASEMGSAFKFETKAEFDGWFRRFWYEYSKLSVGQTTVMAKTLVDSFGENLPESLITSLATNIEVDGKPALGVVRRNPRTGRETAVYLTRKNGQLVGASDILPLLESRNGDGDLIGGLLHDVSPLDAQKAQDIYERLSRAVGIEIDGARIPVDIKGGPFTTVVRSAIDQIRSKRIPDFNQGPLDEKLSVSVGADVSTAGVDESGKTVFGTTGDSETRSKQPYDVSYDDMESGYFDNEDPRNPSYQDNSGESDISYSVKQGKLLGLLQPDRLFPKFSPRVKNFDMGIRTQMGGTAAGAALDLGSMALGGTLTPENALFSTALNATQLLSKSPMKSTAIGAAAGLAATAITGGDIGRSIFNLVGSIGGGVLGGVASGGLGSLGGSVAGGFVADELWKSLFNKQDNWSLGDPNVPNIHAPIINTPRLP